MEGKPYPSDITDEQWSLIEPRIPPAKPGGRRRTVSMREVINGILYLKRAGCAWRLLPHDLPPLRHVHYYYRRFRREGVGQAIHGRLREQVRVEAGKQKTPSAAIIDSQSVKTAEKGSRGYDAGKHISGTKRHIVVDTLGLMIAIVVHAADLQDRDGVKLALAQLAAQSKDRRLFPRLKLIWADGSNAGQLIDWAKRVGRWSIQIVKRSEAGFAVQPKRWIVQRRFAWLGKYRRLGKDYEMLTESSESMIRIAMINLMVHRLEPG
ncbi:IS5 family transposase [Fontivita pretiosa]|uniref:IS5 family transposase n=1 Tax=Fontivita pretiosa TaxID=2989684 RepID=UPI003D169CD4